MCLARHAGYLWLNCGRQHPAFDGEQILGQAVGDFARIFTFLVNQILKEQLGQPWQGNLPGGAGLVVKPSSEEQARFFKEVHEAKKLDSFMPFGGMKESKKKDIDKDIENPGHSHEQAPVPVQAPVYNARIPTRMK